MKIIKFGPSKALHKFADSNIKFKLPEPPKNGRQRIEIVTTPGGFRLDTPICVELPADMDRGTEDIYSYIIQSLAERTPHLIPFACRNSSIFEMAKHLRRGLTSSFHTLRNYVNGVHPFCRWVGREPDELIQECKSDGGVPNLIILAQHSKLLDDFVGSLKYDDLAPATIADYVKGVKALYRANCLKLELPYRLRRNVRYEDRAPTPDELSRLLDFADLRGRVIISCLALGGFREGTLVRLKYRHVKDDLERGVVPIHVHVEAEITKGKYHGYDTFLGKEAADYLREYFEMRRRGSVRTRKNRGIPPEQIDDESPLIRGKHLREPKPIRPTQIYETVHSLYFEAGLISSSRRRRYALRANSIRKFFRTQLAALGVDRDYIEYMMGHTISTYHDIKMKGIEFLRNVYTASGLSIRPKTKVSKIEALKEIVRAWGLNPDEILTREALSMPHRVEVCGREENQVRALSKALKEMMRKELLNYKGEVQDGENSG